MAVTMPELQPVVKHQYGDFRKGCWLQVAQHLHLAFKHYWRRGTTVQSIEAMVVIAASQKAVCFKLGQ
jgi:hypothetical protein